MVCFYTFVAMYSLAELIHTTGLKKEYLINRSKINRNKFYKAIKNPSILSIDEIDRLAMAMRVEKTLIINIINDPKTSGLNN